MSEPATAPFCTREHPFAPHLSALAVLCTLEPAYRAKTVFVPEKQVGRTLTMALAAGGVGPRRW